MLLFFIVIFGAVLLNLSSDSDATVQKELLFSTFRYLTGICNGNSHDFLYFSSFSRLAARESINFTSSSFSRNCTDFFLLKISKVFKLDFLVNLCRGLFSCSFFRHGNCWDAIYRLSYEGSSEKPGKTGRILN